MAAVMKEQKNGGEALFYAGLQGNWMPVGWHKKDRLRKCRRELLLCFYVFESRP